MARPSVFEWDTSNTLITAPPAALQASGWHIGDIPPAAVENWAWNLIGQGLTFLASAPPTYDNLPAALADNVDDGDMFIVDEITDYQAGRLSSRTAIQGSAAGNDLIDVCTTGAHLLVFESGAAAAYRYVRPYGGSLTLATTYTKFTTGTNHRVISDGRYTVLLYGNLIEVFNAETGATIWHANHGAQLNDVCFVGTNRVLAVGAASSSKTARLWKIDDGTEETSFNHGGTLTGCCALQSAVFVVGLASSFASGATARRLYYNGSIFTAADTETGLSADSTATAWDAVWNQALSPGCLATDGRRLFLGLAHGATNLLEIRSPADGSLVVGYANTDYGASRVVCDQAYALVAGIDTGVPARGIVFFFDAQTAGLVARYVEEADTTTYCVATDGAGFVFAGREIAAAGSSLVQLYRGGRAQLFRRADAYSNNGGVNQGVSPWRNWLHRPSE